MSQSDMQDAKVQDEAGQTQVSDSAAGASAASDSTARPKRIVRCVVSSDKMDKSRVGKRVQLVRHPLLGKYVKRTTKFMFHDEHNQSAMGDQVLISPSRPVSARKAYKLYTVERKSS